MVREAMRNYVTLAAGLTDVTKQRATQAAKALVSQGEATRDQVAGLAEDLIATSRKNREAITTLVRYEVERALSRVGVATADQVDSVTRRLRSLESTLRSARPGARKTAKTTKKAAAKKSTAKKSTAKKTARKTPAKKKTTARKSTKKAAKRATPAATPAPPQTSVPAPPPTITPDGGTPTPTPPPMTTETTGDSETPPLRMAPTDDSAGNAG